MYEFLIIIILAITQGITEFLPISSSGHLIVLYKIFKIENGTIFLSILLHFATLLSVCVFFRKELICYIKNFKSITTIKFIITTLFTIVFFLIFNNYIINSYSGKNLIWCFLITSILLFTSEQFTQKKSRQNINKETCFCHQYESICQKVNNNVTKNNKQLPINNTLHFKSISYLKAGIIGIAQGFATLPGISRSGSTISVALFLNVNKKESFDYSFIISIPIILGSIIFETIDFIKNPEALNFSIFQLIIGFIITFIIGLLTLKILYKIIKKQKLYVFSFYLLFLCLFLIIFNIV